MPLRARALLAAPILAFLATPAVAQVVTTVVTGLVGANASPSQDIDTLGLFGPVGADLTGKSFKMTLTFNAAVLEEGGASPGYSAWAGPSGTCVVLIGGKRAKPTIEKDAGIDSSRVYLYAGAEGTWALQQDAQNSTEPNACEINVGSTVHHFVPSAALVQSFAYHPPRKEQPNDRILLDITVNGVRETLSANVKSLTYTE